MWVSKTLGADIRIQLFAMTILMSAVEAFGQAMDSNGDDSDGDRKV
jgi:hypothetical protein